MLWMWPLTVSSNLDQSVHRAALNRVIHDAENRELITAGGGTLATDRIVRNNHWGWRL